MFFSLQHLLTARFNCDLFSRMTKPLRAGGRRHQWQVNYPLRSNSDLPFYCRPLPLFFAIWGLMLSALAFHVSDVSYPAMDIPLTLFAVSSFAFLFGYALALLGFTSIRYQAKPMLSIDLNVNRLRILTSAMLSCIAMIVVANIFIDGLPPLFGFFSFDTATYVEYGRMKQVLIPLLICVFVNARFEPSFWRRIGLMLLASGTLIAYVTRGNVVIALCQALIVLSMTSVMHKKNIYILGASFVLVGLVLATVLGNARTPLGVFVEYLQIRQPYRDYPTVFLWVTTYTSIPLSNMAWIVHDYHFPRLTWSFIYTLLPSFWMPNNPNKVLLETCNCVIDGVHTYLSEYYLNLSYVGVVAINTLIGVVSGLIVVRGVSRMLLVSAVFLSCVVFMYFTDTFTELSTVINCAAQIAVLKYCFQVKPSVLREGA